jgi:hypothetical protein
MKEYLFRGKEVATGKWVIGDLLNFHGKTYIRREHDKESAMGV